jgi:hypothetical protein
LTTGPGGVTVKGRGAGAPFTGMEVEAVFALDASGVATALVNAAPPASVADEWTPALSFPSLLNTVFDRLLISDPKFVLSSTGSGAELIKSLTFSGTATANGPLAVIEWVLGRGKSFGLSGSITLVEGVPEMSINTSEVFDARIGDFNLPVSFGLVASAIASEEGSAPPLYYNDAYARLSTRIQYEHEGKGVEVPAAAQFWYGGTILGFDADLSGVSEIALSDFASFFGGEDVTGFVPSEIPLSDISFNRLAIVADVRSKSLLSVSLDVSQRKPWELLGDKVRVENLKLMFGVRTPPGAKKQLIGSILGDLGIGDDVTLRVSMKYPDRYLEGMLTPGSEINLNALIGDVLPEGVSLPDEAPNVVLTRLDVSF